MSVRSSEPKSNLDRIAYALNITVMIVAGVSIYFAIYFLQRLQYYPYYLTPALLLTLGAIVSTTFAILGFRFILKTIKKNKGK